MKIQLKKMIVYKELIQKSDEWFNVRLGKFTGSKFHTFFGNSKTKENELNRIIDEILTGVRKVKFFSTHHMERGNLLEEPARILYEKTTKNIVEEVGFVEKNRYVGCSPDGMVSDDGIIEIKCPCDKVFLEYIEKGKKNIKPVYITQMQFNMYVSEKTWCDFVVYNPNFEDEPILIYRMHKNDEYFNKIEKTLKECIDIVKKGVKNGLDF